MGNCLGTVGGNATSAREWLHGTNLNFSGGDITLPADLWLCCKDWRSAWILLEFLGTGGSSLTVTLQTAPALSADATAWQDVTSASTTMSTTSKVLQGKQDIAVPPMGALRLKFTAAAQVTGVLRAVVTFKTPT